jgi:uncharacterized SAM-dependent methyltransferase
MISIQVLLTETAIADEFAASFQTRRLDEKFFYWFPLSVRAWLALCSDGAYRNFVRSRSLIARSATELAGYTPAGLAQVTSLGAGQGDKDLILLEALRQQGRGVAYQPVDASQGLLELACQDALAAGFPAHGVKADVTRPDHLSALASRHDAPPRLVMMLGNTLGAFDPIAAAGALRALLRPGDLLLLDGELYSGGETVAGYDNPLNRRFAWAPLHAVGIGEDDGDLRFEVRQDARLPGLYPLAKFFEARRDVAARLGGETLALAAGERVEMNHSYKYAADTFERLLRDAGLAVRWRGKSDDGRFLMVLAGAA